MVLKLNLPSPIFAPPLPSQTHPYPNPTHHPRGPGEIRFSRWNNANAERFNQRRRAQEEIEADIRRSRRFEAADKIAQTQDTSSNVGNETTWFRSKGTPSLPSPPSIPGKKSKYSKPEPDPYHKAKTKNKPQVPSTRPQLESKPSVKISDDGVSYVIDGAPFEFKYSYTEAPRIKPVKLREPPYAPFGPVTLGRPWTGRPPLPPSKKKLKEFDSFELPPPGKKGVKPVQKPGPFLPGAGGPRYVYTREEILGEPLTREEVRDLVNGCIKTRRQLNIGRDGLTHNMLENIHAHWKRRRVCKIKCKGVCTVDMDNVCQQLEEKTGGKVIYRRGGVLFLFRGRNYNYKTRPRFPLMLWRPVSPVYPRLIQQIPEGLTHEEVTEMRRKGRELMPICKLAKNGVYCDLVKNVREAFEVCELVRINCEGIKGSDYRKIGAKLKDLVPCVLISFVNEHILIWRGRDWKSSLASLQSVDDEDKNIKEMDLDVAQTLEDEEISVLGSQVASTSDGSDIDTDFDIDIEADIETDDEFSVEDHSPSTNTGRASRPTETNHITSDASEAIYHVPQVMEATSRNRSFLENAESIDASGSMHETISGHSQSDSGIESLIDDQQPEDPSESADEINEPARSNPLCTEKVLNLMKQAVENGSAIVLDDSDLDADNIFSRAVAFAKTAPPDPVFQRRPRKQQAVDKSEKKESENLDLEADNDDEVVSEKVGKQQQGQSWRRRRDYLDGDYRDVVPQGTLRVDELAKLLS